MTMTPEAPERYVPPDINFQRAAVALDDVCRMIWEYFDDLKQSINFYDKWCEWAAMWFASHLRYPPCVVRGRHPVGSARA